MESSCHLDDGELKTPGTNFLMNRWFATSVKQPRWWKSYPWCQQHLESLQLLVSLLHLVSCCCVGVSGVVRSCCYWYPFVTVTLLMSFLLYVSLLWLASLLFLAFMLLHDVLLLDTVIDIISLPMVDIPDMTTSRLFLALMLLHGILLLYPVVDIPSLPIVSTVFWFPFCCWHPWYGWCFHLVGVDPVAVPLLKLALLLLLGSCCC